MWLHPSSRAIRLIPHPSAFSRSIAATSSGVRISSPRGTSPAEQRLIFDTSISTSSLAHEGSSSSCRQGSSFTCRLTLEGHPPAASNGGLRVFRLVRWRPHHLAAAGIARLTAERAGVRPDLGRGRERLSPGNEREDRVLPDPGLASKAAAVRLFDRVEQCSRLPQVRRGKAFSEPAVHGRKQVMGLLPLAPLGPELCERTRSAQLQELGALCVRSLYCLFIAGFCLKPWLILRPPDPQRFAPEPVEFGAYNSARYYAPPDPSASVNRRAASSC